MRVLFPVSTAEVTVMVMLSFETLTRLRQDAHGSAMINDAHAGDVTEQSTHGSYHALRAGDEEAGPRAAVQSFQPTRLDDETPVPGARSTNRQVSPTGASNWNVYS